MTNFNLKSKRKKPILRQLLLAAVMLGSCMVAYAQSNVSGNVIDNNGEPVIGATIVVKGSTAGTITDFDGNFTVNATGQDVLVISYVGYQTQEIPVAGQTFLRVQLKENTEVLSEVVVVGYGTQKKVNLTGAISTVGAETFADKGAVSTPLASMQGTIPGVAITRTSSSPTRGGWDIQVRGETSVNGTSALVLIDGMPGSLDNINPDDIENISILKDASAAIYGARAAGGVVLVTTKRGTEQKPTLNYKGSLTVRTPGNVMNYMNMNHYMTTFEEAYINDGKAFDEDLNIYPRWVVNAYKVQQVVSDPNSPLYTGAFQGMNTWAAHTQGDIHDYGFYDVDWNDVLWGTALSHSHSLAFSGGTDKHKYNLSLGYTKDNSVLQWGDDNLKKYNVRLSNDYKLNERIKVGTTLSFDRMEKVYPQRKANDIGGQPAGSPISTDNTENGLPYAWGGQLGYQWLAKLGGDVKDYRNVFMGNLTATINLLPGLDLVGNASVSTNNYNRRWNEKKVQWYYLDGSENQIQPTTNKVGLYNQNTVYQNYNLYLEYKKDVGGHDFAAMAGTSYERQKTDHNEVAAGSTVSDLVMTIKGSDNLSANESWQRWGLASYFGRFNYSYEGKYLLELLGRFDGSSKFLPGYRWKGFYGVSAGYRISEEQFMQRLNFFDNLKLRGSYGTTGNQAGISVYDGVQFLTANVASGYSPAMPIFGEDGSGHFLTTISESSMVSATRTWEIVTNANVGLDFAILKNRLSGTFEYFWKENDNMLVPLVYPSVLGIASPYTNNGTLKVHGWELSLNWRDKVDDFSYTIGVNLSDSRNKLVQMDNMSVINAGFNSMIEGQPLNTYWGFRSLGLITTEEDLEAYSKKLDSPDAISQHTLKLGDMMYADTDGDGYITATDRVLLGEDTPHYLFGLNFSMAWKGFDLAVFFQGVGQRTVMRDDYTRAPMLSWYQRQNDAWFGKQYSTIGESDYVVENGLQDYYNKVQTGSDLMPRLSADQTVNAYNYQYSSAWFSQLDGKYVRLKNLTIGYTLPKKWTSKIYIDHLRVYFTGTDLFELTSLVDGWDPEASRSAFGGTNGSNAYPFTRGFSFGIDLTF